MNSATEPLPAHGRYSILAAICLAALVLPMSFTGVAVATPFIGQTFDAHPTELAWITNAFMLSFGSLLMAAGTLADLYGRKRLFMCGMALPRLRPWPAARRHLRRSLTDMPGRVLLVFWAPLSGLAWPSVRCYRDC